MQADEATPKAIPAATPEPKFEAQPLVEAGVDPAIAELMAEATLREWQVLHRIGRPMSGDRTFYFAIWPELPRLLREKQVTLESGAWPWRTRGVQMFMSSGTDREARKVSFGYRDSRVHASLHFDQPVGDPALWEGIFAAKVKPPGK